MSQIILGKNTISPNAPSSNEVAVYAKTDGRLYVKGSDGVETPVAATPVTAFTSLTDTPASYAGNAGKLLAVNGTADALTFVDPIPGTSAAFSFIVEFGATDPQNVTGLPTGWNWSISGTDVTITHNVGRPPASIHYYGYSLFGGSPIWRYRLPTAANEMYLPDALVTTTFVFRLSTSVVATDANGRAMVSVVF